MEVYNKIYQTPKGNVEIIQTKWTGFSILVATGSKGFLACPAVDILACQGYGAACALVESTPDNPIGTVERFANRKVTKVNDKARNLGITEGMDVTEAFELIA